MFDCMFDIESIYNNGLNDLVVVDQRAVQSFIL